MNIRSIICITLFASLLFFSCKKEDPFVEADYILQKWVKAVENLNYHTYRKYEAYPKSESVFRAMYSKYYFTDLMVLDVEKLNEEDVQKDKDLNSFIKRTVHFECAEVDRKTRKHTGIIRGSVDFIHFTERSQKQKWLMWNRILVRPPLSKRG